MNEIQAEINELNMEIHEKTKRRDQLLTQKLIGTEDEIRALKWTKDVRVIFKINFMSGSGMPHYELLVSGDKLPNITGGVTVMGVSRNYQENIVYGRSWSSECPAFSTSSKKMLMKFLSEVEFKEISILGSLSDELEVLQFVKGLARKVLA